jgi:hypothetical protein
MTPPTRPKPAVAAPARVREKPAEPAAGLNPARPNLASIGGPAASPAAPRKASVSRLTREAKIALTVAAVVVTATIATIAYYFHTPTPPAAVTVPPPRVDDSIQAVAAYVAAEPFAKLPFDRQRRYMEVLDDREAELKRAFADGQLDATTYRRALEYAWFGKQLPRMEKFLSLPEVERPAYIAGRLDKKDKGKKKNRDGETGGAAAVTAAASTSSATSAAAPEKITRDEDTEKDIPKAWPAEWQDKWKQYRAAMKEQRDAREESEEDAEAAAQ